MDRHYGLQPDGFPLVGEVPRHKGLWASCSFQGHGIVLCWKSAEALVKVMQRRNGDELADWFPATFRMSEERLAQRFGGQVQTNVEPR